MLSLNLLIRNFVSLVDHCLETCAKPSHFASCSYSVGPLAKIFWSFFFLWVCVYMRMCDVCACALSKATWFYLKKQWR